VSRAGLTIVLALAAGCHAAATEPLEDAGVRPDADAAVVDTGAAGTSGAVDAALGLVVDAMVGAYQLGPALAIDATSDRTVKLCNKITGVVRDFKGALPANGGVTQPGGHPDFEVFEGQGVTLGLVAPTLGSDQKPIYASQCELGKVVPSVCPYGAMTTSKEHFRQWYSSVEGVNEPYLVYFQLDQPVPGGVSTFDSNSFFPLDGAGWGNSGTDNNHVARNFSFTTEIHTTFKYHGGETFTFKGDDDVWIFINGHLAVDLGGLHTSTPGSVDLDASAAALGLTKGSSDEYALDLFHAERHGVESDFRIDTNFIFESCGYIVP
jgi:fibro-slime domain-containing protein